MAEIIQITVTVIISWLLIELINSRIVKNRDSEKFNGSR